jgi:hypothetical protein
MDMENPHRVLFHTVIIDAHAESFRLVVKNRIGHRIFLDFILVRIDLALTGTDQASVAATSPPTSNRERITATSLGWNAKK